MSDAKPFAVVRSLRPQSVNPDAVCVGKMALSYHGCPTIAQRHADKLNAAVARERREAAAEALREAALAMPLRFGESYPDARDVAEWLVELSENERAAAIRKEPS